jgi:hypothetical protein
MLKKFRAWIQCFLAHVTSIVVLQDLNEFHYNFFNNIKSNSEKYFDFIESNNKLTKSDKQQFRKKIMDAIINRPFYKKCWN